MDGLFEDIIGQRARDSAMRCRSPTCPDVRDGAVSEIRDFCLCLTKYLPVSSGLDIGKWREGFDNGVAVLGSLVARW